MQSYYKRNKSPTKSGEQEKQLKCHRECDKGILRPDETNQDFRLNYQELKEHSARLISKQESNNKNLNIPLIKIVLYEEEVQKSNELLKRKEKALRVNFNTEYDNSIRLGLNKNNIIRETLKNDLKKTKKQ